MRVSSLGCLLLGLTFACGGRGLPRDVLTPNDRPDAGPSRDAGAAARDGGTVIVDSGLPPVRDAGSVDPCGDGFCDQANGETFITCPADCRPPDPCPDGTEGCECNSTWSFNEPGMVRQDDCEADLLCAPWEILSGREFEVTGPVQSCVRPCRSDAECGAGRQCADSMPFELEGVGRICVDRITEADTACGGSRLRTSRLPGVEIRTAEEIVGCPRNATCVMGRLDEFHPDEGVCLQECGRPGDQPCSAPTPFCNPGVLGDGAGVCSVGQLGGGSWCRIEEDNRLGFTTICDQSGQTPGNVLCVGLGLDRGMCFELCDMNQPCVGGDGNGPYECALGLLQNGGGLCMSQNCSNFPDACTDPGLNGAGRVCMTLTQDDEGLCVDRIAPSLMPAGVDSLGMVTTLGDDCQAQDIDFLRCPEGTMCIAVQQGQGACIAGCDPMAPNVCEPLLMSLGLPSSNAVCADVFGSPDMGICGGD